MLYGPKYLVSALHAVSLLKTKIRKIILFIIHIFHRFPKETLDLMKWINIIQDFDPKFKYKSVNTVICGNHFAQTDYTLNIAGTKQILKKSSVPSIFPTCVTFGINLNEDYENACKFIKLKLVAVH